jgi:anti-anti-sigma regulatory factor
MLVRTPFPASVSPVWDAAVVIDLIGDVDAAAIRSFAETTHDLALAEGERIVLNLRRAGLVHAGGITMLSSEITALRRRHIEVDVVAEGRRVRTALAAARIPARAFAPSDLSARERHVMIVRNADPARDCA